MLRAGLILMLALSQALPTLAGGVTLCLHGDGSFCLESVARCCCQRDGSADHEDHCCPAEHHDGALPGTSAESVPCHCTHLTVPTGPVLGNLRPDDAAAASLVSGIFPAAMPAAVWPDPSRHFALERGDRSPAALAFLAPVMLRC